MNILIIGAGQSGRGFIPQYIPKDWRIVFVDKNVELISELEDKKNYKIEYYNSNKHKIIQLNAAYTWDNTNVDCEIKEADYIAICVGEQNFDDVVTELRPRLANKKSNTLIVTFENGTNPASKFEKKLNLSGFMLNISITQAAIFCTTSNDGLIDIKSQDIHYLPYDRERVDHEILLENATPIMKFTSFLERKIFTYNCLSAVISYLGYLKGYKILSDAANDVDILKTIDIFSNNLNPALAIYFNVSINDQNLFFNQAMKKFQDPFCIDTIARNCRDVNRKLGLSERLFGPINLIEKYGYNADILFDVVAAACLYEKQTFNTNSIDMLLEATQLGSDNIWIEKSINKYNLMINHK